MPRKLYQRRVHRRRAIVATEFLEVRSLLAAVYPTNAEQYLVELINRGRADPSAEAARYGIDLNEGLAAGTISTAAKQPLAINPNLTDGARGHSQWMINNDTFSHTGAGGSDPGDRMSSAGYIFTGSWGLGENIAWSGTTGGSPNVNTTTAQLHENLFVDTGVAGRGHRLNLMETDFREIGPGVVTGVFTSGGTDYNAVMATEDFAFSGTGSFITGVAYADNVTADDFYTPGEGLAGITITARRTSDSAVFTTVTWSSGGYSLKLNPGTYDISATSASLGGQILYSGVVIGASNVKRDFVAGQGTPVPGGITGTVFDDTDDDGTRDAGEAGLSGWQVYIDANGNGQFDGPETTTATAADGSYAFTSLAPGIYKVREVNHAGWTQTSSEMLNVSVTSGATSTGKDFGNSRDPRISIANVSITEGTGGVANAVFTVTLTTPPLTTTTVNYATADGGAIAGLDYTATSGTLTFNSSATSQTISVPIATDSLDEPDEIFTISLSSPVNGVITTGTATGTIIDDDPPPSLSIADVTVTEGSSGTVTAVFTVTLSAASGRTINVNYATANGTATAADYTTRTGSLSFSPGTMTQTISVPINPDVIDEADETFLINLSGASNATIADAQATGTITDDDPPPLVSVLPLMLAEGTGGNTQAIVAVALSAISSRTVTVDYTTSADTALAGEDFTAVSGTLTFAPGATSQNIVVPINSDSIDEPNETILVNLSNPGNATLGVSTATVTITDDDLPPAFTFSSATYSAAEASLAAKITILRTGDPSLAATVRLTSANGTATSPADYAAVDQVLNFSAGQTSRIVNVPLVYDTLSEKSETVLLTLSDPSAGTNLGGIASSTLTILNSAVPVIKVASLSPRVAALADGQTSAYNFGTLKLKAASPVRTFRVSNAGKATLKLGKLSVPPWLMIVDPLVAAIAPGGHDDFAVKLRTAALGTFKGQILFATNAPGKNPFNFAAAGAVVRTARAPSLALPMAYAAKPAATPQSGLFANRRIFDAGPWTNLPEPAQADTLIYW